MNIRFVSIMIIIAGIFGVVTASAQRRPHDQVMKDIQATFGSLKKNLDANNSSAAGGDATRLQELFGEIEAFWAALKTKDAVGFAKSAGTAAAAVGTAAQNNDIKAAQESYTAIQKNCGSCHSAHREQIATGFRIRP